MPIYEFYCADCHMLFNFFSRRIDTQKEPACPRCGRPRLSRRVSLFAVSRRRPEKAEGEGAPEIDEERMSGVLESLAREAEGADEEDPRSMARILRRLYEATGMPLGPKLEEAMRRLEAGEDPEALEQELGDALGEESELLEPGGAKKRLSELRMELPPRTDPNLYEL